MSRLLCLILLTFTLPLFAAQSVRVVDAPAGGKPMFAKAGPKGESHLVYEKAGEVWYALSTDDGSTWGTPLSVTASAPKVAGLEYTAWDMAVGPDGRVHVAIGTNAWKLKLPKDQWGYYYASLALNAQSFSPLKNLNHMPSEGFSLAAGPNGKVGAFFIAGKVYGMLSSDGGNTFSAPAELSTALLPCECCTTKATVGPNGSFAIFYRDKTGTTRDMYFASLSSSGQVTKERVSATPWPINSCPMTYYSIEPAKSGYVVAWPTKEAVYFGHLNAQGKLQAPGEVKTTGSHGMRTGLMALEAPNGHVLVAWNNNNTLGWQEYDETSLGVGAPGSAKTSGNGLAMFSVKDGFVVVK
jgi:hypothetical protein